MAGRVGRHRLLALVGALVALACGSREAVAPPNVLLVSLDTLRADHLGCYGYERPTSPALDRLAREGVLFEQVVANSPWTLPSHASMLTGLYPRTHGVKNHLSGLRAEIPTLATILREHGYQTMALVNWSDITGRSGLARGFENFLLYPPSPDRARVRSAKHQVRQAINWIENSDPKPFFLFLHNYDLHSGYDPAPAYLAVFARPSGSDFEPTTQALIRVRKGEIELSEADLQSVVDHYDAGIRELDRDLKRLLDYLERSGRAAHTVIAVTSDHGEEFLEHGDVLHGRTMYDEVLNVPLILRGPGVPSGVRVRGLAQLSDLLPTILALVGVPAATGVDGRDLGLAWRSGALPTERLAFAEADHRNREDDVMRAVRLGSLKLIHNRLENTYELYDLERDADERRDVASEHPDLVARLMRELERYMSVEGSAVQLPPLSEEEVERLRSLGYLQ